MPRQRTHQKPRAGLVAGNAVHTIDVGLHDSIQIVKGLHQRVFARGGSYYAVAGSLKIERKQLKDMSLKPNTLLSFINRSGKIIIPTGNDTIEVGDTVMVVTKNKGFTTLTDILR